MNAKPRGFTLSELLIALIILGVIGTFSITKLLQVQQYQQYRAMAKEAAATVSAAYLETQRVRGKSASIEANQILDNVNSVKRETVASIQIIEPWGSTVSNSCGGANRCFLLHNGGILRAVVDHNFYQPENNTAIAFVFDPDGSGTTTGVTFNLYYNGRITSQAYMLPSTRSCWSGPTCSSGFNPNPNLDPSWFSW